MNDDHKKIRILYVGYGALGRKIVGELRKSNHFDVQAIVDPAVGETFSRLEDYDGWQETDCVIVTTVSALDACMPTFRELLGRGQSVISTCEELFYPWLRHPELAKELNQLAVQNGARILGTGVNPGFLMDSFPLAVTKVCANIDAVKVVRIQDAARRRLPFQKKIGAGLTPEEFKDRVENKTICHVGLLESLHFLAHYLEIKLEDWNESIEAVRDDTDAIIGVRQVAKGLVQGKCKIELFFQAAVGQSDPHDRIVVWGTPKIDLVFRGGVHGDVATSAVVINSIAPLLKVRPGLHTMATIPLAG